MTLQMVATPDNLEASMVLSEDPAATTWEQEPAPDDQIATPDALEASMALTEDTDAPWEQNPTPALAEDPDAPWEQHLTPDQIADLVDRARTAIALNYPEFASYLWKDTYFDESSNRAGIVAVFDHDWTRSVVGDACCVSILLLFLSMGIYITLCVSVLPDRFLSSALQYIMFMMGLFVMMLCGFVCPMLAVLGELTQQLPPSPHTAVKADGVLHVTGGSYTDSSVVAVTGSENGIRKPTDTCRICMEDDLSAYRLTVTPGAMPPTVPAGKNHIWIQHLVDSQRFQKIVSLLKNRDF